jgi:hypothetical protein
LFAGFRLAENKEQTKHLIIFYWLQVPWISSPIIGYRFSSGCHFSACFVFIGSKFNLAYLIGSNWWFSLFKSEPWGIGVNAFALAMALILIKRKKPIQSPEPPVVTPVAAPPPLSYL